MDENVAIFVVLMTSIGAVAWLINNWIRARHGIPTDEELALKAVRGGDADRQIEALRLENERLNERLAVLERIATDPAERTAREIEELR